MASYKRFEDLPAWQAAAQLYEGVSDLIDSAGSHLRASFRDQLERATLSISNNIAEGFERGSTKELLAFLYISRGSAGEVRSMLTLLARRPWAEGLRADIVQLKAIAESCSRQIFGWASSLQNSEITGVRHLNDDTRERYRKTLERNQAGAELDAWIDEHLAPNHPLRQRRGRAKRGS